MDVREKLVKLLQDANNPVWSWFPNNMAMMQLAEYLISSGVTVQEWIAVDDRLPEHGDVVLCFMKFGGQHILLWDEASSWWLGYGSGDDWQKADVTHWQYLPQPPKGE